MLRPDKVEKEDYCKCGPKVPLTWLGKCEECKKEVFLSGGQRPYILHPLPFEEASAILKEVTEREKASRRGLGRDVWNEVLLRLLDAALLDIEKGFFLLGHGIFCNPRLYGIIEIYFTSPEGARLWKDLNYSGALYALDLCEKKLWI